MAKTCVQQICLSPSISAWLFVHHILASRFSHATSHLSSGRGRY